MNPPVLLLHNRQRGLRMDLRSLRRMLPTVARECLAVAAPGLAPCSLPPEVEIALLSSPAIGRVHARFFGDPTPTDVITFPYGEILLGAGIIAANAQQHGHSNEREAVLCIIHGLLHLRGFDDIRPADAACMRHAQQKILAAVFPAA